MTEDRTLQWHEAFREADVHVLRFVGNQSGFLDHVVWSDTAPIGATPLPVVRRFVIRIFTTSIRHALVSSTHDELVSRPEAENLVVQMHLPGFTPAKCTWMKLYTVPYGTVDIANFDMTGAPWVDQSPWTAVRTSTRTFLIHMVPVVWSTIERPITCLVKTYARLARFIAARPTLSSRITQDDGGVPSAALESAILDALAFDEDAHVDRSGLDMDSNQE